MTQRAGGREASRLVCSTAAFYTAGMIEVQADPARNLVIVTFQGHVDRAQAQEKLRKVTVALETVQPGFRLLTDFTELDAMDYECAPEIQATMDLFRKKGVAEVLRVMPDLHKDIGFKVMSFFHYGRKVSVLTLDTRTEALKKLAG
jgi:hypothetical protein